MSPKVMARDALARWLAAERASRRTVAMANGIFDILHVGHVRYLQAARREADILIVGVNGDASARALK